MANNFSTIKDLPSSQKFFLARIEPARSVESNLTLNSGTTYEMTFPFNRVSKIEVDGVEFTKVSSAPSGGEFSFDLDSKLLQINLGTSLTSQAVIAYYYLFYSTNDTGLKIAPENPLDLNTDETAWVPRISIEPSINFDQRDIVDGFISFGDGSILIDNQDHVFEQYLTDNDSFSNKKITFWQCLDDVENCQISYRGFVSGVSVSERVSLKFFDEFSRLDETIFSNISSEQSTYNINSFPNMRPDDIGTPIRKLYAQTTYYKVIDESTTGKYQMSKDRLLEAVNINYVANFTSSNNREWGCAKSDGMTSQTDSVTSTDHSDPNFSILGVASNKNYRIGDAIAVASQVVRIVDVDTGANTITTEKDAAINVSDLIERPVVTPVIVQDGVAYYPQFIRDYTYSSTSQTNDIVKITFVNNFETTLGVPNTLNPDSDLVLFRQWADNRTFNHADVIQEILEDTGFTVDSSSFTTASATDLDTNFYIPFVGDQKFPRRREIIERLVNSTFGMLGLNTDLEFVYKLFSTPSTSEETTDRHILLNSFDIDISYKDIYDSIIATNEHDIIEKSFTTPSEENARARYLHGISNVKVLEHLLASPDRISEILDVLSERRANYSFKTKGHNFSTILSDDVKIVKDNLLGTNTERTIRIISINKKSNETTLIGTDLLGL